MMKRKIMIAVCSVLILCLLSGCQLARENAGANAYEDRLIGLFITTEYLDLFDFENYLNDNISGFRDGEITIDGNAQKYQGRLYATLMTRTPTSDEAGGTTEIEEYIFEGIDGIACFSPTVPAADGRDSYIFSMSDEAISDGHMSLNYGDDKNSTTLTGTIYTVPSNMQHTYYFNPVYQSEDGSVYAVSGSGFMVDNEADSEGSVYSQTLDATTTVTENGKSKTESISITLSISVMLEPEKIIVLQMNTESELLSRTEYAPGILPEVLTPEADTAYLVVETYKRDDMGNLKIAREIYGRDNENIETFSVRADGVCVKHWTQIKWG